MSLSLLLFINLFLQMLKISMKIVIWIFFSKFSILNFGLEFIVLFLLFTDERYSLYRYQQLVFLWYLQLHFILYFTLLDETSFTAVVLFYMLGSSTTKHDSSSFF